MSWSVRCAVGLLAWTTCVAAAVGGGPAAARRGGGPGLGVDGVEGDGETGGEFPVTGGQAGHVG